jgi:hypothetical protein
MWDDDYIAHDRLELVFQLSVISFQPSGYPARLIAFFGHAIKLTTDNSLRITGRSFRPDNPFAAFAIGRCLFLSTSPRLVRRTRDPGPTHSESGQGGQFLQALEHISLLNPSLPHHPRPPSSWIGRR